MTGRDGPRQINICKSVFETFERQVLVFPLLVVLLACASFLFGGTCAAWQWWTAVAAVVAVPFARRARWRASVGAAGMFALLLFALRCLIPPLTWDDTLCVDMPVYHLPMIQLLVEGWNPVVDPTAENITAALGLDLWGMAPLHVAFQPKTFAVFSAVAHSFVGDPFALTFPGPFLLWLGVLLSAIRTTRGFVRLALVAGIVCILPMVDFRMFVDQGLAFASCGLLLAMQDALRQKKCDWLALAVWSAWMMNLKLNGVLGAFVFCAVFAAMTIWKNRTEWKKQFARFAAFGCVLVALWGLVSWNPLVTSWRTYGHPLYPFKTVDAGRFPVKDLTWDLGNGNDDYREMGKLGLLAHAYLSPKATVAFYRWKTGRADFEPDCEWWPLNVFPSDSVRAGIWLLFAVLFLVPGGRAWAFAGLVLLVSVPDRMAGYTRYQPWLSALGCLALKLGAEWAEERLQPRLVRILSGTAAAVLILTVIGKAWMLSPGIECKAKENGLVRERIRPMFWGEPKLRHGSSFHARHFVARYNYLTCMQNHAVLFMRELGREGRTIVAPSEDWIPSLKMTVDWDERNWHPEGKLGVVGESSAAPGNASPSPGTAAPPPVPDKEEFWMKAPFGYYVLVDRDASNILEYFSWDEPREDETEGAFLIRRLKTSFHAWFATFPREAVTRLVRNPSERCP